MVPGNSSPTSSYWLCPLYSFNCYCESVDLAEGILIKRIPPEFEDYLQRQYSDWFWIDPSDAKYMIVFPMVVNNESKSLFRKLHVSDFSVKVITALRLCHVGAVTPGPLVRAKLQNSTFSIVSISSGAGLDDILPGMEVGPILTSISKEGADLFASPEYQSHQSDVPQINELVKNLIGLRDKKPPDNLGIALRRFNSSYHGELEDRLIDQAIAFESLYLGHDQELKYRLALRVAFLLGKKEKEEERKVIFDKIRKAYKIRSDIVHGNKQLERSELKEVVSETEEYLRQSIRKFLSFVSQGRSMKQIREKLLDENIIKNGRVLSLKESD